MCVCVCVCSLLFFLFLSKIYVRKDAYQQLKDHPPINPAFDTLSCLLRAAMGPSVGGESALVTIRSS